MPLQTNQLNKEKGINVKWTQFNNEHTKELMMLAIKYPRANAILLFLNSKTDRNNACRCSYQELQEVLECSQATIARNIKVLKDFGFIDIVKSGNSSVYIIKKRFMM